jgi:homoserine kinase
MPSVQSVTIRIPASTSNLGPGFDCLGVALRIYNLVRVRCTKDRHSQEEIVLKAADLFFKRTRKRPFPFSCSANEGIPRCRGLGSSATIRLGVVHGLNELTARPLDRSSIFRLCAELEGHPDNAAPASFGGFTVASGEDFQRCDISQRLKFVLLIPDLEIQTKVARRILPKKILHAAAVDSARKACSITAAFMSRNYQNLHGAFGDEFHQPFRVKLLPFLPRVIAGAENTGALGAFLSGSGSTICAVTLKNTRKIGRAMQRAARTSSQIVITTGDNRGVQIGNRQLAIGNG